MADLVNSFAQIDAGGCPSPFVSEILYPFRGGWSGSRVCQKNILSSDPNASKCCLPCPIVDYLYQDNFYNLSNGTAWVHVGSFILCSLLLISMIAFPKQSRRAYLNIVLLVGVLIFDLGFIIPLARKPPKCFDRITQVSMSDNFTCAISGAFASFGALFLVVWVLVRALFMHLQICWDILPGPALYIGANVIAFSVCVALETAMLVHSGVSMKWGHYCHVNLGANATYWGWLLAFAGSSFLLQLGTCGYVMKVFIAGAFVGGSKASLDHSGSFMSSSKSQQARAAVKRMQKVLVLQWRSLAIVTVAIFTVTFACVVFVVSNDRFTTRALKNDSAEVFPWIVCLVTTQKKSECYQYIEPFIVSEALIIAALFVMAFAGVWAFVLLCRLEIFQGWWDLLRYSREAKQKGVLRDGFMLSTMSKGTGKNALSEEKIGYRLGKVESKEELGTRPTLDEESGPLQQHPSWPAPVSMKEKQKKGLAD